jgi:hypothetical protein
MIQPTRRNNAMATTQNIDVRIRAHMSISTAGMRERSATTAGLEFMNVYL